MTYPDPFGSILSGMSFTAAGVRSHLQRAPTAHICLTADDVDSLAHGKPVSLSVPDPLHLGCPIRLRLVPPSAPNLPPPVPYMFGPDAARAMGGE